MPDIVVVPGGDWGGVGETEKHQPVFTCGMLRRTEAWSLVWLPMIKKWEDLKGADEIEIIGAAL